MEHTLIIGIAGGSGYGKSTITEILKKKFGEDVTVINHDNYYKAQHDKSYEERTKQNYDAPDAFDTDLLAEHLELLRQGFAIDCPVYDYTQHDRSDKTIRIEPSKVLIIDGILVLAEPKLRDFMDIKIFVDTPADIRFIRRLKRDVKERARTIDSITEQYLTTVKPMHDQFLEPTKQYADIIIPQGKSNTVAIDLLKTKINSILSE